MQAGEIEIAVPPTASTINAVGEGSPIVGWLSPASQLPQLILATEEVTSCEDLEGRTAAPSGPGDLVDHLMATYARTCGLEDAATILSDSHYQLLVSRTEWVEQNRELVVRAAASMLAANRWITDPANRDEVIETAALVTERDAEKKFPTTCEDGFRQESLEFTVDLQVEQGNLQEAIPVQDVIDPTICADAERSGCSFSAFFPGVAVGVLMGVVVGNVRVLNASLGPLFFAAYTTPFIALIPLLLVLFGFGILGKTSIVFFQVWITVVLQTIAGIRNVDPNYLEVATAFRTPPWRRWFGIALPAALPFVVAGLRLAIGRALVGVVVAEFETAVTGLEG